MEVLYTRRMILVRVVYVVYKIPPNKSDKEKQDSLRRIAIPITLLYLLISPQLLILMLIVAIAVRAF